MSRASQANEMHASRERAIELVAQSHNYAETARVHAELAKASAVALLADTIQSVADAVLREWARRK